MTTSRTPKSLRVFFALMLGLAVIAMHQLGNANPAHSAEMAMVTSTHINHSMHVGIAMDDLHSGAGSRGLEHQTSCHTDEHSCQGVATQDFSLAAQPERAKITPAAPYLTCSKYAAARQEHDPPGRTALSVWRI